MEQQQGDILSFEWKNTLAKSLRNRGQISGRKSRTPRIIKKLLPVWKDNGYKGLLHCELTKFKLEPRVGELFKVEFLSQDKTKIHFERLNRYETVRIAKIKKYDSNRNYLGTEGYLISIHDFLSFINMWFGDRWFKSSQLRKNLFGRNSDFFGGLYKDLEQRGIKDYKIELRTWIALKYLCESFFFLDKKKGKKARMEQVIYTDFRTNKVIKRERERGDWEYCINKKGKEFIEKTEGNLARVL